MESRNLLLQLTEKLDLHMEPMPGIPLVEIAGEQRVLIENHQGITAYDRECIVVKVRYGSVRVHGSELCVTKMDAFHLIIHGMIRGITLCKRGDTHDGHEG